MDLDYDRRFQLMALLGMTAALLAIYADTLNKQEYDVYYDEDDDDENDEDDDHYQTQEDPRRKRRRNSNESQDLGRENLTKRIRLSQQSLRLLQTQQRPPSVDRTLRWVSGTRSFYEKP
ncbi:hypothetical protein PV10_03323 [Exophiala mesophila]|uniref:Uncharacterized protein n=1 Tax=Exophiala mesophila TaxID=212818 RepID=A0A0D1Y4V9_EXOME|nr:uncharacterized protein PV10_03323 [Exophiala mesophila]KIV95701.1 hypothetical protein PV10_03323 [Exophiala mesophila]